MGKHHLHNRLEELHGELQQIESVDENERQILQQLMGDIKKLVQPGESDQHHEHLYERLREGLREGIKRLEASHPRVTMLMGQLIDSLANIGI